MTAKNTVLASIKPLIARLIHNFLAGDYDQRREAAIALSKFKGEKATDFLLQTYESDNIQDFMALALGNIDNHKAIGLLINALNDSQQEVRFNAAQALGMLENPEAFDILMEALNTYSESNVGASTQALEEHASQIFFEEDAIISAIIAVGKIKNWRAISLLKKLLAQEKSARIRASIIMALGNMASDKLMPVFQAALRDEDPRVRANAIEAIETIKSGSIVGILQPYLEDPNNRVRANVAKAIWKYGDFDVSETLRQMLEHTDKWYRASAAYAIGEMKDSRFIRELGRSLKDEDPDVRRNATNALRKIEMKDALPHLKPMLDDPNFDVRVEAALALSRCAPEAALPMLKDKLQREENFIVQATLISCLGQIAGPEIVPLIIEFLNCEDPRVISNTIDAMVKVAKTPTPDMIAKLKDLLQHEDNRVKSTAIRTLWVWGEYNVLDNLHKLFKSEDRRNIQSATFVLGEIGKEISLDEVLLKQINNLLAELIGNPDAINQQIAADGGVVAPVASLVVPSTPLQNTAPGKQVTSNEPAQPVEETIAKPVVLTSQILPDKSFDEEIETANRFIAAKNFPAAEKIFKTIHLKEPQHLKSLLGYANLCFLQKKNNEAAKLYLEAIKINPNLVKAHFNLGTIYFYGRKYEDAVKHLVKALSIYPKILGAYLILGQIYQIAGKFNESVKLLTHAAALSPRNPVIYQKLATLHIQLKQYDKAIEVLLKAVDVSPVDVESNLLLAYCFNLTGQHQKAFSAIDLTLRACAQSPQQDASLRQMLKGYLYLNSILQEQSPGQERTNDA
ncbi:MAG TPA: HEAT repeat domain-containing protein [Candidatus Rifleibacterium sp.]|nr:HEAT repeat domain-containing protein [Candidatus Rifleibacterium sp.]HPT47206.1 HEAT repeat domain-containing protein [Candidatus Rifleibacterium sp.]